MMSDLNPQSSHFLDLCWMSNHYVYASILGSLSAFPFSLLLTLFILLPYNFRFGSSKYSHIRNQLSPLILLIPKP